MNELNIRVQYVIIAMSCARHIRIYCNIKYRIEFEQSDKTFFSFHNDCTFLCDFPASNILG